LKVIIHAAYDTTTKELFEADEHQEHDMHIVITGRNMMRVNGKERVVTNAPDGDLAGATVRQLVDAAKPEE
jgi:hypothetical protein